MKRRIVSLLLGCALTAGVWTSSAHAMTYAYALNGADEGSVIYIIYASDGESETALADGSMTEYDFSELTKEEQEELSARLQEEMEQQLAPLEAYGVSYDADKEVLYYQGKTVRYVIDQQSDTVCSMIRMPEGEIDVYTVRDEDGGLSGLYVASQDEYDAQTARDDETAAAAAAAAAGAESYEGDDVTYAFVYDVTAEPTIEMAGDGEQVLGTVIVYELGEDTDSGEYAITIITEEAPDEAAKYDAAYSNEAAGSVQEGDILVESEEKIKEYAANGIDYDANTGSWLWQGKVVYFLLDEDGSLYQNGLGKEENNRIYLLVKRASDGGIDEVKQITAEQVVEEKLRRDLETED